MLVCGEDLGLIPPCVPRVMSDLGVLGLRIQRMPSDSSKEGEFGLVSQYPYHVVSQFTSIHLPFYPLFSEIFLAAAATKRCCDDRKQIR